MSLPIDPFTIVNRTYLSHISGRPNTFINSVAEPYPDPSDENRLIYNLNIVLLPTQILMLPAALERRINPTIFQTNTRYSDTDLKYKHIFLYQI